MARRPILGADQRAARTVLAVATIATSLTSVAPGALGIEIEGTVNTLDGQAVHGAIVSLVSVASRSGSSKPEEPSCGPDCGRHTVTDEDGAYIFRNLEPGAEFTLYAEAKNYCSRFRRLTIDSSRVVSFTLPSKGSTPDGSQFQFAGRVVRADGKPAAGALISRSNDDARVLQANNRIVRGAGAAFRVAGARPEDFEPWTTTDEDGNFFILTARPTAQLAVIVEAAGAVKGPIFQLWRGAKGNTLQLTTGATILGRVLKDARGVEGVTVGLSLSRSEADNPGTPYEATSGRDGRFVIEHVPSGRAGLLFTKMDSPGGKNLAAIKQEIYTGRDGQVLEVAELNLHPTHEIRGRLVFSDTPSTVAALSVVLNRISVPDRQQVEVDEDNTFVVRGVPSESVTLSFHTEGMNRLHGYRLSPQHFSLDYVQRTSLCGRVDDDLDLIVLLEPGDSPSRASAPTADGRMVGIVVQQQGGGRRIVQVPAARMQRNPLLERQRELEDQPLRGVSADALSRLHKK